jgi:hypothetical protein
MVGDANYERERRRLAEWYASMTDGEMEKVAGDTGSLSDAAKEALEFEISRRGSEIAPPSSAAPSETEEDTELLKPIILRRFRDLPDALLAKSILDSASIECFLIDEHTIRMDWMWSNALGGVKLWVRSEDADAADLLDQGIPETFVIGGVGEYLQPRCPECHSFDTSFRELKEPLDDDSALDIRFYGIIPPILLPLTGLEWKCHSCGYRWDEIDDPPEEAT